MFEIISPERAGISSKYITKFIKTLEKRGLAMHSVLLMKGDDIFAEYYWEPFDKDFCHRMYSETKSYVAIAIGLLEQDGKLNLDECIYKYFPEKLDSTISNHLKDLKIKDMLTMQTTGKGPRWFTHNDVDRTHIYLNEQSYEVPAGMRWKYDSAASQVLSSLVEKLSGMTLFEFLYQRVFSKLGTFNTAKILKTKNDDSWGDSALLCTTRDMASFGRFLMKKGAWNGEQILNENFVNKATSRICDNDEIGFDGVLNRGYGYQIWRCDRNGFAFNGMGAQLTLCFPEKDLLFVCTSDNQGYTESKALILTALYELIVDNISPVSLPENEDEYTKALSLADTLKLVCLSGEKNSSYSEYIDDVIFECDENDMGITSFKFKFLSNNTGELHYTNAQGNKVLKFGLGKNVFSKFPQFGYSNEHGGTITTDGFMYNCATSAAWREPQKLFIKVQIIDKYFGNMFARFSFNGNTATVTMVKTAENFLEEYQGTLNATRK